MKKSVKKSKGVPKFSKKQHFTQTHLTIITITLFAIALLAIGFMNVPSSNVTGNAITGSAITGDATNLRKIDVTQNVYINGDNFCDSKNGENQFNSDDCGKESGAKRDGLKEGTFIYDLYSRWSNGTFPYGVSKFLLFFLLFMLIFSILRFTGFFNGFLTGIVALVVSFLATAYIIPAELFTILTVYTGLGLALSIGVPFFVMLIFSIAIMSPFTIQNGRMVAQTGGRRKMFQYVIVAGMWSLFVGFIIYRIIYDLTKMSTGMLIVMAIILAVAILFIVKPSWMVRFLSRYILDAEEDRIRAAANLRRQRASAAARVEADAGRDPLDEAYRSYD